MVEATLGFSSKKCDRISTDLLEEETDAVENIFYA